METFKTIEGFEDYEVSNLGTIKSLKHGKERILKPGNDACGYVHVRLYPREPIFGRYKNGDMKPKLEKIHRLVAMTFLPLPDTDTYYEVNHKDGDKKNNDVTNLEWLTRKENMLHGWRNGLMDNGAKNGSIKRMIPVKLTYKDGSIRYYRSRSHAALDNNTSIVGFSVKIQRGTMGRKGYIPVTLREGLPEGASFTTSDELEQAVLDYRDTYRGYLDNFKKKKNNKKG